MSFYFVYFKFRSLLLLFRFPMSFQFPLLCIQMSCLLLIDLHIDAYLPVALLAL